MIIRFYNNPAFWGFIFVIAITEALIMTFLTQFQLYAGLTLWLIAIFDASIISIVSIIAFTYFHNKNIYASGVADHSSQLKIGGAIFSIELIIMLVLPLFMDANKFWVVLIDGAILSIVGGLVVFNYIFLPSIDSFYMQGLEKERNTSLFWGGVYTYLSIFSLISIAFYLIYHHELDKSKQDILYHELASLELTDHYLFNDLEYAVLDSLTLSQNLSLLEIANGKSQVNDKVEQHYQNYALVKPIYEQVRFIGLDGKELIRVHRNSQKLIEVVEQKQLQNKAERYYFSEILSLDKGKVYISAVDLNIERGQVEVPLKPMIRVGTPVLDDRGNKRGILVINLMADQLLDVIQDQHLLGKIVILNEEGDWLHGKDNGGLKGLMYPERELGNMQSSHPNVWMQMQQSESGWILSFDGMYVYHKVTLNISGMTEEPYYWWVTSFISNDIFSEKNAKFTGMMLSTITIIGIILAVVVSLVFRILGQRIEFEARLLKQANFDFLTGLSNKEMFTSIFKHEFERNKRNEENCAVFYLDLDDFKSINDTFGHDAGDEVLKQFADRLQRVSRKSDVIARLGGDEFSILMVAPVSIFDAEIFASRIIEAMTVPFDLKQQPYDMGVSVGIALNYPECDDHKMLMEFADQAMYKAKSAGKNGYYVHNSE